VRERRARKPDVLRLYEHPEIEKEIILPFSLLHCFPRGQNPAPLTLSKRLFNKL